MTLTNRRGSNRELLVDERAPQSTGRQSARTQPRLDERSIPGERTPNDEVRPGSPTGDCNQLLVVGR